MGSASGPLCCFSAPGRPRVQVPVSSYKELKSYTLNKKQFEILFLD